MAILVDQDQGIETDRPFVDVFSANAAGQANFDRAQSTKVGGRGIRHVDFSLTSRGNTGWRAHSIGRRSAGFFASRDTLRQTTDGDSSATGRFEVRIVEPGGDTIKRVFVGNDGLRTYDGAIQALKGGGFVVAYTEAADNDKDVVFHLFKADGTAVRSFVNVATTGAVGDNNNEPAIAPLGAGGFIIFYDKDTGPIGIRGQRYNSYGGKVGDDFLVASENGGEINARLLDDSRVAVVYRILGKDDIHTAIVKAERPGNVTITTGGDGDDVPKGAGDEDVPDLEGT